jgi:hypothetical protein
LVSGLYRPGWSPSSEVGSAAQPVPPRRPWVRSGPVRPARPGGCARMLSSTAPRAVARSPAPAVGGPGHPRRCSGGGYPRPQLTDPPTGPLCVISGWVSSWHRFALRFLSSVGLFPRRTFIERRTGGSGEIASEFTV